MIKNVMATWLLLSIPLIIFLSVKQCRTAAARETAIEELTQLREDYKKQRQAIELLTSEINEISGANAALEKVRMRQQN